MIDSVTLRINNLSRHERLQQSLVDYHKGVSVSKLDMDRKILKSFVDLKFMDFHADKKSKIYYKGWLTIPSSEYNALYTINMDMDYVEWKFSVPKVVYGTNITQLIPHSDEVDSNEGMLAGFGMKENAVLSFKRFRRFIKMFLELVCVDNNVPDDDIVIKRIDLCFNQIFNSKEEALEYLSAQKRIRKKYVRDTTKEKHAYRSSIYIVTEDYTAKIYHKGAEYEKNDAKVHRKINNQREEEYFKIDDKVIGGKKREGLKSIADRILRYEIEFKNSYMSKLFFTHIFRTKDKEWLKLKRMARKFKAYEDLQKRRYAYKRTHSYKQYQEYLEKVVISKYFPYTKVKDVKMDLVEQKMAGIYLLYCGKGVEFCYDVSKRRKQYNQETPRFFNYLEDEDIVSRHRAKFGNYIFMECYKKFREFFMQYQLKEKASLDELGGKIAQYNKTTKEWNRVFPEEAKTKIRGMEFKTKMALLSTYTLEELVQNGIMSRTSAWRFKKQLEKIGYSDKNILSESFEVSMDYERYKLLFYEIQGVIPTKNYFFM